MTSGRVLTARQIKIWALHGTGLIESDIAHSLDVTRQTVHKALDIANGKVSEALIEAAHANRIQVKNVNPVSGVLIGYSPAFKTNTMVTFSKRNSVQVWYKDKEHCEDCNQIESCRKMLIDEAEERGIQLPEEKDSIMPSKLADILFSKIVGIENG
jgi:transcriptional regulator